MAKAKGLTAWLAIDEPNLVGKPDEPFDIVVSELSGTVGPTSVGLGLVRRRRRARLSDGTGHRREPLLDVSNRVNIDGYPVIAQRTC